MTTIRQRRPGAPPLPGPPHRPVRNALLVISLCIAGWLGCGSPAPGSAPRDVLERYLRASAAEDWATVYQLTAAGSREGRTLGEFAAWRGAESSPFVRALEARTRREVLSEQIDAGRAELRLRVELPDFGRALVEAGELPSEEQLREAPLRQVESRFSLVKEDGGWRVIAPGVPEVDPKIGEALHRATQQQPGPR